MKKGISVFLIAILFCFSLNGCGISGKEAKEHINSFFEAVEAGDYEEAETYLHPERPAYLEEYFNNLKEAEGLDFQSKIEIERYTGFSTSVYDSTIRGSSYALDMNVLVGDDEVYISIEIVSNDDGYGIYAFDVTP